MKVGDAVHGYQITDSLGLGGSDREFFRCRKDETTFIIIYDKEIEAYLRLHRHLMNRNINVPRVYWHSLEERVMVQEDLGNTSLFNLTRGKETPLTLYKRAIDELIKLQIDGYAGAPVHEFYDREHICWEQGYFRDHFLIQYCGIPNTETTSIDSDLRSLADQLLSTAQSMSNYLMHRDYQSQNIYIKDDQTRIIDFQSARIGPLTYDLAALLRDAYVDIDQEAEKTLNQYYLNSLHKRGITLNEESFQFVYELTCLQRNMQALGAFANLSLNKDKPHFKQYIPRGLALLKYGLQNNNFRQLNAIVSSIRI